MILDTPTHVFSPDEQHYPISDAARQQGDDMWFRRQAVDGDGVLADNVRACIDEPGVAGIRLFSWGQTSNEWLVGPDARAIWKVLADARQVLDVAVGAEELPALAVLTAQFPSMPIVVDHAGFLALGRDDDPSTKNLFDLVALPNVNVKVRLLWGSNYTATAVPSYRALVDQAQELLRSFRADVVAQISAAPRTGCGGADA